MLAIFRNSPPGEYLRIAFEEPVVLLLVVSDSQGMEIRCCTAWPQGQNSNVCSDELVAKCVGESLQFQSGFVTLSDPSTTSCFTYYPNTSQSFTKVREYLLTRMTNSRWSASTHSDRSATDCFSGRLTLLRALRSPSCWKHGDPSIFIDHCFWIPLCSWRK